MADAAAPAPPSPLKSMIKAIANPVFLLLILIAFSFAGAKLFMAIEGPHETREKYEILEMREDIIGNLWNSSRRLSIDEVKFSAFVKEELKRYEAELYTAFAHGINSDSDEQVWDLWGSFIYCTTIYTTVGYGHMAPATTSGRVATMLYALVGIPLCLIVLAELGKLFTLCIKFPWSFINRKLSVDDEFNLPLVSSMIIAVAYMVAGAVMYMQWEDWDYLDAFYFIFISISTVGFGDVLPTDKECFLASFIYQLFGLALLGMVINVVMEALQNYIQNIKSRMVPAGKLIGIPADLLEDMEKKTA